MQLEITQKRNAKSKFELKLLGAISGYVFEANRNSNNELFKVRGINEVQWTLDNILNEVTQKNSDGRSGKTRYKTVYNDNEVSVVEYFEPSKVVCRVKPKPVDPIQPVVAVSDLPAAQSETTVTAAAIKTADGPQLPNQLSLIEAGTLQTRTAVMANRKITKQGSAGYTGNKYVAECYKKIINQLPQHRNFISGFLGNCAVLREKQPAKNLNIGIEVNQAVILQYWKGWQSPDKWKKRIANIDFMQCIVNTPTTQGDELTRIKQLLQSSDTLLYLDPPYLLSSRASGKSYYRHELTDKQHEQLLNWCNRQNCLIAISHYPCELYDKLLTGPKWRKTTYQVKTHKEVVTEALYMNYPEPAELHEYTWLGNDCWERQGIKRKLQRLTNKLMELPAVERNAIIHHIKTIK